jgi:hypothetical protein
MGLHVSGMAEWQRVLDALPERAPKAFRDVVKRGGVQIKKDWQRRWREISHPKGHIPHLIRNVGFDESEHGATFTATVGVQSGRLQTRLASIISYGSLTSAPHDAGREALEAEVPNMQYWAGKVAAELLEEAGNVKVPVPRD